MGEETTFRHAIRSALADELEADAAVVLLGEDIGDAGGVFKVTEGLQARFGTDRVRDTPISETAIIGAALGAAINGLRPVAELMFADFAGVAWDQLANQVPKFRYMTGGQVSVPMTVRAVAGAGFGFAAQHSGSPEAWFMHVPGWRIVAPSTCHAAYWLTRAAVRSADPVLVLEHKMLYGLKGVVGDDPVPIGASVNRHQGDDATVVATMAMVAKAVEVAEEMAGDGLALDVIDLQTLAPLDLDPILESAERTGRLITVEEAPPTCGWGAEVVSWIVERADRPIRVRRVTAPNTPIPFAPNLEHDWIPQPDDITAAVRSLL